MLTLEDRQGARKAIRLAGMLISSGHNLPRAFNLAALATLVGWLW